MECNDKNFLIQEKGKNLYNSSSPEKKIQISVIPMSASKSNGNLLVNSSGPKPEKQKHSRQQSYGFDKIIFSNEEDGESEDPTDMRLEECFTMLQNSGSKKSEITLMQRGNDGQTEERSSQHASAANGGIPFYELSFNNSTHFLNHLAHDGQAPTPSSKGSASNFISKSLFAFASTKELNGEEDDDFKVQDNESQS